MGGGRRGFGLGFHRVRRRRVRRGGKGSRRRGIVGLVVVVILAEGVRVNLGERDAAPLGRGGAERVRGGLAGGGDERARGAERALARGCGGSRRAGVEGRARRAGGWARRRSRGRARGLVLFGPDGGVERGVEVEGVGLLRNVVRKAGGARGDVRGVGGGDVGVRGARRGAGGEVRSGTAAARDAAGGGGGGRRRRFGGGGGFLRAHGNPGLPPALAPALVYLGQETHGGRRRGGAADDVPEISNSRTKRRTGRDDQPAAPRVPRRTRNLSARVSDDRVRSRQSRASVGRRRATRSELHPVGRGGGCPLPPATTPAGT